MGKVFFAMAALVFAVSVIGGCRAEGELDTDEASPVVAPR